MARLLDKLSQQPQPLLFKVNLDKQPEEPLLQRLFSRLPKRRPGERYAFGPTPHAFLAEQPANPPLAGVKLFGAPRVSASTWLDNAPLSGLASSQNSLLGNMDSHRMPGIVTSVLLLTLCLAYLMNLPATVTAEPETAVAEETTAEPAAEESMVADSALTPDEEAEIASTAGDSAVAAEAESASMAEDGTTEPAEAVMAAAAEEAMATPVEESPAETTAPAETPEPAMAPAAESEAPTSTSEGRTETVASAPQPAPEPGPAAPAEPEPKAAPAPVAKPKSEPTPAPAPKAASAKTTDAKPAAEKPAPAEPAAPVYYNEQRSLAMLTEARYLYLTGEGKVAAEKLGLAVSAGHIKPDYADVFSKMEADIKTLLGLFETAQNGETAAVQAFLDAEEAVFPGQVSSYEAKLPIPEPAAEEPVSEPAAPEETPRGLQSPDDEPAQQEAI